MEVTEEETKEEKYMSQKIPIVILNAIQETGWSPQGENRTYYFNPNEAMNLKKLLLEGRESDLDDFKYELRQKIGETQYKNTMNGPETNVNNSEGKLKVNVLVGHHTIFKEKLDDLLLIEYPEQSQNEVNNVPQIKNVNTTEEPSVSLTEEPSVSLMDGYENFYENFFNKFLLTQDVTERKEYGKQIISKSNTITSSGVNSKPLDGKPLFEKLLLYIFYKKVNNQQRRQYYEKYHVTLARFRNPKVKRFYQTLLPKPEMSTVPDSSKTSGNKYKKLLLANGSVLLIYRKHDKLLARLLFCGFPDKTDNYLNYDYTISFSKLGEALFTSVLAENEGIIFVRHEHSFHNGLTKHKMLDAPLSSLGIYKSMLINQFLNSDIFSPTYLYGLSLPGKQIQFGNLYDFVDIKQMTVSPLIRTHMTGLLIFGNKYVSSTIINGKLGSQYEGRLVEGNQSKFVLDGDNALNALIANFKKHSQLDKSNNFQSIENVAKKFQFNINRRETFRRRTYKALMDETKLNIEDKLKGPNKRTSNNIKRTLPAGPARFGGARRQRQTKRKRKLKTKKAKKHIKKRRTYKNKK